MQYYSSPAPTVSSTRADIERFATQADALDALDALDPADHLRFLAAVAPTTVGHPGDGCHGV